MLVKLKPHFWMYDVRTDEDGEFITKDHNPVQPASLSACWE
jgi:hypothetical protein